jgi:hypothetical protein
MRLVGSVPIEPHIPDEPTEASVKVLLEQMIYGLAFYCLGRPVPLARHMPPGGKAFELEAVLGVCWLAGRDLDMCTVYIDKKPFKFAASWVQKQVCLL